LNTVGQDLSDTINKSLHPGREGGEIGARTAQKLFGARPFIDTQQPHWGNSQLLHCQLRIA
jgi:hypothetical protein